MHRLLAALVVATPALALAEPLAVTHQGYLLGTGDIPVDAASIQLTFKLYNALKDGDSSERLIWQSKACTTAVKGGRYVVVLGSVDCNGDTPLATEHLPTTEPRFLEIAVAGERLLPRLAVTASPTAATARNAEKLGGVDLAGLDARFDAKYAPIAGSAGGGYALLNPATPQQGDLKVSGIAATTLAATSVTTSTVSASGEVTAGNLRSGAIVSTGSVTATEFIGSGAKLTGLNANELTLGILPDGRLVGTYTGALSLSNPQNVITGSGAAITDVNAAKIGGQTLDNLDARYARISGGSGGSVAFGGALRIGNGATTCDATTAGTMRWDGSNFVGCDGVDWRQLNNQPPPSISSVTPGTVFVAGGATVTINGARFGSGATVTIGGVNATNVQFVSSSKLTCVAPATTAGVKEVRVVNADNQAGSLSNAITYYDPVYAYTGANQTFTVPPGVTSINVKMWGAGGGGGRNSIVRGGSGGYTTATLTVIPGEVYTVVVGQGGARIVSGSGGGAGGGLSGLFLGTSVTQSAAKLIAGGGGGGGYYDDATYGSSGGNGGGATGGDGAWPGSAYYGSRGMGATQSAGGAGGIYNGGWAGANGSALQGGGGGNGSNNGSGGAGGGTFGGGGAVGLGAGQANAYGTGGGGGGYWGGGGGSNNAPLGGGGGSGFLTTSGISNGVLSRNNTPGQPDGISDSAYAAGIAWGGYALNTSVDGGGNGRVVITW